jgi:hypothetical protein
VMGDMMQMGMGVAMAGQMANQMGGIGAPADQQAPAAPATPTGPPPLPGQKMFHVDHGGSAGGPYNMAQMQAGIGSGQVTGQTLVWSEGMPGWSPAQAVPELQALFATPPPMPPASPTPPPVPE